MKPAKSKTSKESKSSTTSKLNDNLLKSFFPSQKQKSQTFFGTDFIQPKLKIGQPGDKYEQEADRMADQVMRMPDPQVQRQPKEKDERLQMKSDGISSSGENIVSSEISGRLNAKTGAGRSLSKNVQSEMSQKIGADFSNVSIHTDSEAEKLNQQMGARAFTHGRDIYFNDGEYKPESSEGKHLLAHELTHVVQQTSGSLPLLQRQSKHPNRNVKRRYPYQRKVKINVKPKPKTIIFLQKPKIWKKLGKPIPASITMDFLVKRKLEEGDERMTTALFAAAGKYADERLKERLKKRPIPYGPLNKALAIINKMTGGDVSREESDQRFLKITLGIYIKQTQYNSIDQLRKYYRRKREFRKSMIPKNPISKTKPKPEQVLYFEFDSTNFNQTLTTKKDWVYTVRQVWQYIYNVNTYPPHEVPLIQIEGYSSKIGAKKYNKKLSIRRANKVKEKLKFRIQSKLSKLSIGNKNLQLKYNISSIGMGE